jgi:hypothetical protein
MPQCKKHFLEFTHIEKDGETFKFRHLIGSVNGKFMRIAGFVKAYNFFQNLTPLFFDVIQQTRGCLFVWIE